MPCPRGPVIAACFQARQRASASCARARPFRSFSYFGAGGRGDWRRGQKLRTLHKLQAFCKKGLDKAIDLWYNGITSIGDGQSSARIHCPRSPCRGLQASIGAVPAKSSDSFRDHGLFCVLWTSRRAPRLSPGEVPPMVAGDLRGGGVRVRRMRAEARGPHT